MLWKSVADLRVSLNLRNTGNLVLHRILNRDDLVASIAHLAERGVERS